MLACCATEESAAIVLTKTVHVLLAGDSIKGFIMWSYNRLVRLVTKNRTETNTTILDELGRVTVTGCLTHELYMRCRRLS